MEVELKFRQPLKQVLSSLEKSISKYIQSSDSNIDIELLKDTIQTFQKNIWKQIDYFSQRVDSKASTNALSEIYKQDTLSSGQVSNTQPSLNQLRANQNSYIHTRQHNRSLKNCDSDSEFNIKSDENISSQSSNSNEEKIGFSSKYNILTSQDKQFIVEFFKKHYDPNKRNKMKLVQTCQKHINQSFNSIYSMITYLMRRYKHKSKFRQNVQKYNEQPQQQQFFQNKHQLQQQQQESSDEIMDEELVNKSNLNYSLNEGKDDGIIDDDQINNLLSKYDYIPKQYESNNFKGNYPGFKPNGELIKQNHKQKQREEFQQNQSNDSIRNNQANNTQLYQNKTERMSEYPHKSKQSQQQSLKGSLELKSEDPFVKSKSRYSDQREVAYNSEDDSFDDKYDKELIEKYN